ncbi:uncharacterized protein I206_107471 [Kwoniella pini CBS 10737]|uniref:Uncharacterized protein n=1 Tax=Kwoniella pini CBS 10737 TaxID=1296096 RepID=A0A1B9HXD3_9TREE|nr:uncharacterized protein I206_05800 [Kwoniella pini CBS 10737]OCF47935.1 hypothetical protein I206_05800 [Kwoniella pini CBS 10737]
MSSRSNYFLSRSPLHLFGENPITPIMTDIPISKPSSCCQKLPAPRPRTRRRPRDLHILIPPPPDTLRNFKLMINYTSTLSNPIMKTRQTRSELLSAILNSPLMLNPRWSIQALCVNWVNCGIENLLDQDHYVDFNILD